VVPTDASTIPPDSHLNQPTCRCLSWSTLRRDGGWRHMPNCGHCGKVLEPGDTITVVDVGFGIIRPGGAGRVAEMRW